MYMTKLLWNAIGYHQPNKNTNRTVCALGLQLDCVVGQLQGTVNMLCLYKWTLSNLKVHVLFLYILPS